MQIKAMAPSGKLPQGILLSGSGAIHQQYVKFYSQKMGDIKNEGFPTSSKRFSEKTRQKLNI